MHYGKQLKFTFTGSRGVTVRYGRTMILRFLALTDFASQSLRRALRFTEAFLPDSGLIIRIFSDHLCNNWLSLRFYCCFALIFKI